jgi:hypothetical protein
MASTSPPGANNSIFLFILRFSNYRKWLTSEFDADL